MNQAIAAGAAGLTPERVLSRLEWRVIRRLDGRLQGDYRTLFRGPGIDVADLREYQPYDDVRHIDWNVTARTGLPHVRVYDEDREVTTWLLLDRSPSMGFGPIERRKHQVVVDVAATMAQLLTRGGNRIGAVLFDAGIEQTIPPRHGRNQVLRILSALMQEPHSRQQAQPARRRRSLLRPRPVISSPVPQTTDLAEPLRGTFGIARRRSLIIIVSDFVAQPGWERPLALLARRHDVLPIQVMDPRESELPAAGMVYVEDAETGEQIFVNTSDPAFQRRLRAAADERQAALTEAARSAGTDLFTVGTDEDLVRAIARIAELRRRARLGSPRRQR
jgi:uncharacterized protein (DUF58 family)